MIVINLTCYDEDNSVLEKSLMEWNKECFPKGRYVAYMDEVVKELVYQGFTVDGRVSYNERVYVIPIGQPQVTRDYEENDAKLISFTLACVGNGSTCAQGATTQTREAAVVSSGSSGGSGGGGSSATKKFTNELTTELSGKNFIGNGTPNSSPNSPLLVSPQSTSKSEPSSLGHTFFKALKKYGTASTYSSPVATMVILKDIKKAYDKFKDNK